MTTITLGDKTQGQEQKIDNEKDDDKSCQTFPRKSITINRFIYTYMLSMLVCTQNIPQASRVNFCLEK
uniref:Uncharacterized protein n=1 Tax=Romanomermis culicivorax TaxID=13658 RepID=A0A915I9P3_ROMCU